VIPVLGALIAGQAGESPSGLNISTQDRPDFDLRSPIPAENYLPGFRFVLTPQNMIDKGDEVVD
jgi:hypothetical protein